MRVELLEDLDWNGNDLTYKKGEILEVVEFDVKLFADAYARYYDDEYGHNLDWIPKNICKLL